MSTRLRPSIPILAMARIALAVACGAALSGCAARQGPAHIHDHCHLVEKHDGGDRSRHHMRICHAHKHRPDHH